MNPLPERTDEERRAALRKAAEARRARAELKRRIKEGGLSPWAVMDSPVARRIRVRDFLRSIPGIGRATEEKIMGAAKIGPRTRIGGLGCMQRARLVEEVSRHVR